MINPCIIVGRTPSIGKMRGFNYCSYFWDEDFISETSNYYSFQLALEGGGECLPSSGKGTPIIVGRLSLCLDLTIMKEALVMSICHADISSHKFSGLKF